MSIKKFFFQLGSLILIISLCLLMFSCQKEDKNLDNTVHTTKVKKNDFVEYGDYIYCEWGGIYRYNRKTEKLYAACTDIECDGRCPLKCTISTFAGEHNGRLYFCGWQALSHTVFFAYQNIANGEITVLKTLERNEDSGGYSSFIDGEYLYYKCMVLKEGGDVTNSEDYEPYICRIMLDGTKDEIFIKCDDSEGMIMVGGGKVITSLGGILYSVDVETKEKSVLFDFSANGCTQIASTIKCLDGKIYFLAVSKHIYYSEITQGEYLQNILFSIDLGTRQIEKVIDEPVIYFCLTDDAIYYVPFEFRILYMPKDYENNKDDLIVWFQDDTLYACDLNGQNIRAVCSNDKLCYTSRITVVDGVVYSWFSDYDEQAHTYKEKVFFGGIDFDTGRVIRTETPK